MLHIHRSERADALVGGLAELLREPPADPFEPDVVAVPAKGVERWLSQRLSHVLGAGPGGDGVCARVGFPHPSRLVAEVVSRATAGPGSPSTDPDDDPWSVERLTWAVLALVESAPDEPWAASLRPPRGHPVPGRRVSAAQHVARLFDSYAAHRPAMLRAWAAGDDVDGVGASLREDLAWQPELWRRTREAIGTPSPAEQLLDAVARLRVEPAVVELPERLSVFGPTRVTTAQLEVVVALAERRDVHLWLPHASPAHWERLAAEPVPPGPRPRKGAGAITFPAPRNPLLASLGRDAAELEVRLQGTGTPRESTHHAPPALPPTLLGRVQRAIRDDVPERPLGDGTVQVDPGDRSLQVHACHGPERQTEVLREVVLGLLADDPTLEPRDVLVMCPDVEDYAPLVSATFGLSGLDEEAGAEGHPGHRLRVRLADRSVRQTNPLVSVLAALLDLAGSRLTSAQVLDLAGRGPVRRRFGLSADDLDRIAGWVTDAGVRWGRDAGHRADYGLGSVPHNTWRSGLDRLLLGVAMAEDDRPRWLGLALPLDDVDSDDVDLAGRLAELVDRLATALDELSGTRTAAAWVSVLDLALTGLADVGERDEWMRTQARRELGRLTNASAVHGGDVLLGLDDVRAVLADGLRGRPTRASFRTGDLTMCSMVPMRSVPHRVVCLLGMDDGAFPRAGGVDGDDVLAARPCLGERDPRSEDRQLLLDAVMAAGDHLVVLYTGADPRTNARRPPAVPVGELLDAAEAIATGPEGVPLRNHVVVRHPLQPFDARNFSPGRLGRLGPFSFDPYGVRGARRAARPRSSPPAFLDRELPPPDSAAVSLEDLVAFLEAPVRGFLRQRLGIALPRDEEPPDEALPLHLDGLAQWQVGDRLLRARLAGAAADECREAEWRRGTLPPGRLGERTLAGIQAQVEPLVAAAAARRGGPAGTVDVSVDVPRQGTLRRLTGTIGGVHPEAVVRVEYSRISAKHRLRAWVQLLALSVARPEKAWTAVNVGRGGGRAPMVTVLGPVTPTTAQPLLSSLVGLREQGLCGPLPLPVKSGYAYAAAYARARRPELAEQRAKREWLGDRFPGERAEPAHVMVFGESAPWERLVAEPAAGGTASRFAELALDVWLPALEHETDEDRS